MVRILHLGMKSAILRRFQWSRVCFRGVCVDLMQSVFSDGGKLKCLSEARSLGFFSPQSNLSKRNRLPRRERLRRLLFERMEDRRVLATIDLAALGGGGRYDLWSRSG